MILLHTLGGLAFATAGGFLFFWLDIPLAYILGAMAGSALYSNLFGRLRGARQVRRAGQLIVGTAVAALLTPAIVSDLLALFPWMIAAAVGLNLAAMLVSLPVAHVAGVDRLTAILSCLPAGMSEMASLAQELGAQEQVVAWVQTLRVILVVSALPLLIGITGNVPASAPPDFVPQTLPLLVGFFAVGSLLSVLAARIGLLNPWVVVPMMLGLCVVGFGGAVPALPQWAIILAQLAIGAALGSSFRIRQLAALPRATVAGILSALALIAIAPAGVARLLETVTALHFSTLALSLAPGGLGEMIATAKSLGVASATVAGFQFSRAVVTNLLVPLLIRRWMSRGGSRE